MNMVRLIKEKAEVIQAVVSRITSMEDALNYTVTITGQQGGFAKVSKLVTFYKTVKNG